MQSKLNPYLAFNGNALEAMEFYRTVFGGKLESQTFGENHAAQDPNDETKIMHATLEAENGITLMACDTATGMEYKPGTNISMSLSGSDDAELSGYFQKLAAGATITMPLETAPWGDKFGMVTDKYGIAWMVNIDAKK